MRSSDAYAESYGYDNAHAFAFTFNKPLAYGRARTGSGTHPDTSLSHTDARVLTQSWESATAESHEHVNCLCQVNRSLWLFVL